MHRILCLKIASRGDLLLAAPAFARLRASRPDAHVTLLVGESCEDVARHLPYFDEVRTIDDRTLFGATGASRARGAADLFRALRGDRAAGGPGGFSEVLIFHRDWRYAALAMLARVPVRRGLARGREGIFLTHPYAPGAREHHTSQYLGVVVGGEASPAPEALRGHWRFPPGEHERLLRSAAARGFRPGAGEWVALGFGGGRNVKTQTALKQWPVERYRELAALLTERGARVLWLGDQADAELLGEPLVGLNLVGKLSVPESAAVLRECSAMVANDTLLLHLAQALGVPSVGIFGPTDPEEYRPLGERSSFLWMGETLACSPCHQDGAFPVCAFEHQCMRGLAVSTVLERVEEMLMQPLVRRVQ